jgi:adenylate cyclase
MTVRVLGALWGDAISRGEMRAAFASAEQMLEISEREEMPQARLSAHAAKAFCLLGFGELGACRHHSERVIERFDPELLVNDLMDPRILALSALAQESALTGRFAEARGHARDLVSAMRARGVATDIAIAEVQALSVSRLLREPEREAGTRLLSFCAEHKIEMLTAAAKAYSGWAMALGGDATGAALIREGLLQAKTAGVMTGRPQNLGMLAEAEAAAGQIAEALATLDDALCLSEESRVYRPDLLRLRGELLAEQGGDLDSAEATYREAIECAFAMGALLFELRAATGLARLLQRRGRAVEGREILEPIYSRFKEGFELRDLVEAKATLDAITAEGPT